MSHCSEGREELKEKLRKAQLEIISLKSALKETETKNVALQEIIAARQEDSIDQRLLSMLQNSNSKNETPKLTD